MSQFEHYPRPDFIDRRPQGCGFTGPPWSADFNGHFAWCQGVTMADLTREDQARKDTLSLCTIRQQQQQAEQTGRIATCQNYARKAVDHEAANQHLKCGFAGGARSRNYEGHFNWCLTAAPAAVTQEDSARYNQLLGCISVQDQQQKAKQAACLFYADYSMCMSNRAVELECSFRGTRWGQVWQAHYQWCLGASDAARERETAARDTAMDECRRGGPLSLGGDKFMAKCP